MTLRRLAILTGWLGCVLFLRAEPQRDLNKIVPVQRAIFAGREAMRANDPAKAVRILEAEQANAAGNTGYDALLKEARAALAKTGPADIIEPTIKPAAAASLAPPIPPPPAEEPAPSPGRFPEPEPKPLPILVAPPKAETDPFQQTPTHGRVPRNDSPRIVPSPAVSGNTRNFVLKGVADPVKAGEVIEAADAIRTAMYQRWGGTTANDWNTPCEITLHACGDDYRRMTRKPESLQGHATVGLRGQAVVTRQLDLCGDDPVLLDVTLPNELTQMILLEMYAEQPPPKWALIGMAALSETPESVARYRRTVPGLLRDRKLLMLSVLMEQQSFPEAEATTAFYAQSISLVSFLVEKKGGKAFAAFLREAPRRGIARALQSHYGFKDVADLQQQWLKSLSATQ